MRVFKWCKKCKIPLIQPECGNYLIEKEKAQPSQRIEKHSVVDFISRIKPVGNKEYQMYKELYIKKKSEKTWNEKTKRDLGARFPKVLYRSRNYLYSEISEGTPHFKLVLKQNDKEDADWKLTNRLLDLDDIFSQSRIIRSELNFKEHFLENSAYLEKLIVGNSKRLESLEIQAIKFIKKVVEKKKGREIYTSFSGGKDSAVTAYLVNLALGKNRLLFSNTDIEYQETLDYIDLVNEQYKETLGDVIEVKSPNDFLDLCVKLGPPSRTMRWCCSTQKATPVNQYYSTLSTDVVSFDGIRRDESNLRAEYPRQHQNTKLPQQYSAYPILDWSELDVWIYTLWRKIPINPLYQEGFARVGCWACPNNGLFDTYLFEKIRPERARIWENELVRFAKKISEEQDHQYGADWIWDSVWKGRRVKYHNEIVGNITQSDQIDFDIMETENTFTKINDDFAEEENFDYEGNPCTKTTQMVISLESELSKESYEFLKIFGSSNRKKIGSRILVKIQGKRIIVEYFENSKKLKYQILAKDKNERLILRNRLIRQINKSLNCLKCAACVGACPNGAIVVADNEFRINLEKCSSCLRCTSAEFLRMGCVALHYKPDRRLINRKVLNATLNKKQDLLANVKPELLDVQTPP